MSSIKHPTCDIQSGCDTWLRVSRKSKRVSRSGAVNVREMKASASGLVMESGDFTTSRQSLIKSFFNTKSAKRDRVGRAVDNGGNSKVLCQAAVQPSYQSTETSRPITQLHNTPVSVTSSTSVTVTSSSSVPMTSNTSVSVKSQVKTTPDQRLVSPEANKRPSSPKYVAKRPSSPNYVAGTPSSPNFIAKRPSLSERLPLQLISSNLTPNIDPHRCVSSITDSQIEGLSHRKAALHADQFMQELEQEIYSKQRKDEHMDRGNDIFSFK